jgi:hypothetical protein
LASPVFTGDPQAPTPATADNDTSIATTAFVKAQGYATTTAMNTADNLRVLKAGDTLSGSFINVTAQATAFDSKTTSNGNSVGAVGRANTVFGMVGYFDGVSASYSFWGNNSAFLAAGTWATSDGNLKAVTGNLDPAQALTAVNAIAVKQYRGISPEAYEFLYGIEGDEALYGWIAQEVEQILPIAVRDVLLPKDDARSREAVGGDSVKAINDRYMLTMLWAAVQALSARVAELEGAP